MLVFAGVRRETDWQELRAAGGDRIRPLLLDVTEEKSIATAAVMVEKVVGKEGLHGLVNNAGVAFGGPLEFIPQDDLAEQMSVNLFGALATTQALLPMIKRARGRIVNMGSVSGMAALPFLGPYSVSKFALEGLSDCLRMELRPLGVSVSLVEPGSVATPIWSKSRRRSDESIDRMPEQARAIYGAALNGIRGFAERVSRFGASPERVARAVEHALSSRWPKPRYILGLDARSLVLFRRIAPTRVGDWVMLRMVAGKYRRPRTPRNRQIG